MTTALEYVTAAGLFIVVAMTHTVSGTQNLHLEDEQAVGHRDADTDPPR